MSDITTELEWEKDMVDAGVAKYLQAVAMAKYGDGKGGDESATSYGVSLIREFFEPFEKYIEEYIVTGYKTPAHVPLAAQYISRCDVRTVAYIAARCIIDSISKTENQTTLAFRIAGKVEDQMRLIRFSDDYPKYLQALLDDMEIRGIKDYRRKRRTLVRCHARADRNAENVEWIPWPDADRLRIGVTLLDLFINATQLIAREMRNIGNRTYYYIVSTQRAIDMIQANMDIFQFMSPEFMPTLIPPKDWTTPFDGGYWHPALRDRRPMVKIKPFSRQDHIRELTQAQMPGVYDAVNIAQAVPWKINTFVMEQVGAELNAGGIGCPVDMHVPCPESPYPIPEQDDMSDAQYKHLLEGLRAQRTPDEMEELAVWRGQVRQWYEKQNSDKAKMLALFNTFKIAKLLAKKERFYYVHTLDSRGRLYPCGTHVTPQGTDMSKGMLQFAEGTPLGRYGYWHLCIHAAGVYGEDKVSLEDRVAWVHAHSKRIMDTWCNPESTREFWGSADKPFMFLAACKELAEIWAFHGTMMLTIVSKEGLEGVATGYISHLPCAQDGSCNGIQHFTAMLCDPVGAHAVNMTGDPGVNDIYGETAEEAARLMREHMKAEVVLDGKGTKALLPKEKYYMNTWLDVLKVDRKVCKRSTMIIPYGGQKTSCLADVKEVLIEKLDGLTRQGKGLGWTMDDVFHAGFIMHHYVWKALDTVVVAARKAMRFLGRMSTVNNRSNRPMIWTTPLGFPCYQDYKETKSMEIETVIAGRMRIKYSKPTDNLNKSRMHNAFAPNFVHSMDATHLMMTVLAAGDIGISNFALVHDSYGVPAGQCEGFHAVIRQEFVRLYSSDRLYNLLTEQKTRNPTLKNDYPGLDQVEPGAYTIEEVLNATYFFR